MDGTARVMLMKFSAPEPVVAIVVAAGSGVRLGNSAAGGTGPKALRTLAGVSLLRHSAQHLIAGGVDELVIVCQPTYREMVRRALIGISAPLTLADGGSTRQESVRHGIEAIATIPPVVLVHDAARPLVPAEVVARVIAAIRGGARAVVPVIPVTDSIRSLDDEGNTAALDRSVLRAVQTPQGFDGPTLAAAHRAAQQTEYTDDASVCEAAGARAELVEGSPMAMKITMPQDFAVAETLLATASHDEDAHESAES